MSKPTARGLEMPMNRKRAKRTDLHGLLVIDKPTGLTSFDVVKRVRRHAGGAKTGHAGTLDPLATGVLICALGRATKSVESLMAMPKTYHASIDLSAFSVTDDAEGPLDPVAVTEPPNARAIRAVLDTLTGTIEQTPPAYSAMKVNGRRAYDLARQGRDVALKPRPVRIDAITIDDYHWPRLILTVTCGRGTYIRALARQIGQALDTGGYLTDLRRTAIGPYRVEQAMGLAELPERLESEHLRPIPGPSDDPDGG